MEALQRSETHLAFFPSPGMGHLIPLVELAQKIVQLHSFSITFIITHDGLPTNPQKALLETFPSFNFIFLPSAIIPDNGIVGERIIGSETQSIQYLCKVLTDPNESGRVSAFITNPFGSLAFHRDKELGIPSYIFCASPAMALSFAFYLPELDKSCTCEYRDSTDPIQFPGCLPVHGSDLVDLVQDRKSEAYRGILEMCKNFALADGILVNSFLELQPDTCKALEQGGWPPVYHVGLLIRPSSSDDKTDCLKWLDEQPAGSVLFVSFGSGGTLSTIQLKELAMGLEKSEQKFLFVASKPNDNAKNAAYFTGSEMKTGPLDFLPHGFIERNKEKGLIVAHWAPQVEVLDRKIIRF